MRLRTEQAPFEDTGTLAPCRDAIGQPTPLTGSFRGRWFAGARRDVGNEGDARLDGRGTRRTRPDDHGSEGRLGL